MKIRILAVIFVLMLAITACNNSNNTKEAIDSISPDTEIMKINNKSLTKADFIRSFNKLYYYSPFGRAQINLDEPKNFRIKMLFRVKAVNDLIIKEIIEEEASKKGIKVTDDEVNAKYNSIVERFGGPEKLQTILSTTHMSNEDFKQSIKDDILAKKTIDIITKDSKISESDIKKYYEDNKLTKFNTPETVRASHIFFEADERILKDQLKSQSPSMTENELNNEVKKAMDQKYALAKQTLQEVLANPSGFEGIAKAKSEDKLSAMQGGDIGYFAKGKLQQQIDNIAFDPKKAQISKVYKEIIKSNIGFHILKVTDHRKGGIIPFDAVKNNLNRIMSDNAKVAMLTKFVNDKKNSSKIEYKFKEFDSKYINKQLEQDQQNAQNQVLSDIKENKTQQ